MAVYTSLSTAQITHFLQKNSLPELLSYQGISAGIENSNYRINTSGGVFILTLYEHFTFTEVQPYLMLLQQLGQLQAYYPSPITEKVQLLANKPAVLFQCLSGQSVIQPNSAQLRAVAIALARLHLSSPELTFTQENPKGMQWIQQTATRLTPYLSNQERILLSSEMQYQQAFTVKGLAQGVIHADLFKDNVLFSGEELTGFLDLYAACYDCYLLDIAIALNDWCADGQGNFNSELLDIFLQAYQTIRALSEQEQAMLPLFLRRACLRFWLSRLEHQRQQKTGELILEKSPEIIKQLLLQHRGFS